MITLNQENEATPHTCKFCSSPLTQRFIDMVLCDNRQRLNSIDSNLIPTYVCSECFLIQFATPLMTFNMDDTAASLPSSSFNNIEGYINKAFKRFEKKQNNLVVELNNHTENSFKNPERSNLFFGNNGLQALIDLYGKADLLITNDELANVYEINDFVSAIKLFLKPSGIVTFKLRHLLPLMESNSFKTTIKSYVPYFSFTTIDKILNHHNLTIFDVKEYSVDGYFHIYAKHPENTVQRISDYTRILRGHERDMGMSSLRHYIDFKEKVESKLTTAH